MLQTFVQSLRLFPGAEFSEPLLSSERNRGASVFQEAPQVTLRGLIPGHLNLQNIVLLESDTVSIRYFACTRFKIEFKRILELEQPVKALTMTYTGDNIYPIYRYYSTSYWDEHET